MDFQKQSLIMLFEQLFENFKVNSIRPLGSGYDSIAYLVNEKYVFKVKTSNNEEKGYRKEKAICDFLNKNLNSNVVIPNIEYSYISEEISIIGYKKIEGKPLNRELYSKMTDKEKELLKKDLASFLRYIHDLNYIEIQQYVIDNKKNVLQEYQLLKNTIYNDLTVIEKKYIEEFMKKLDSMTIFNDKKCLCHNDFSCNHILLNGNNRLCGIIDFGDAGITDEYCDFIYLLEDSDEEIGHEFGEDILKQYGNISIKKAKEYQEISNRYYPIETIIYGIKNNKDDFIERGRKVICERMQNDKR